MSDDGSPRGSNAGSQAGDEEEKVEIEEPEPDVPLPELDVKRETENLTRLIKRGLSKVAKTQDGTGYAFTDLDVSNKRINDLYLVMAQYSHLRTINFSKNNIPVLQTLTEIPQLLILNASNNRIDVLTFMTYESKLTLLREVDLSNNKIMALPNIQCPKLRKLNLTGNVIEDCYEFKGHPTLETLILNKNKLKNCKGLGNCPRLMELDLSENVITEINDLKDLPALKNLNLKKNEIETLVSPMPDLPRITKLNVEENKVADGKNFEPLKELKSLREFYCLENPLFEEGGDNLKRDLMKSFLPHPQASDLAENSKNPVPPMVPNLSMFNEDEIVQDDIDEVWQEKKDEEQKRIEEEEERKREEEERLRELEERRAAGEDVDGEDGGDGGDGGDNDQSGVTE